MDVRRAESGCGQRSRADTGEPPPSSARSDSPDVNPIANAFAKLKTLLRKAAARAVDHLWRVIGDRPDAFTPAECANYFVAAGYDAY